MEMIVPKDSNETLWIYVMGGDMGIKDRHLSLDDRMATLTIGVTVKAKYKYIKKFLKLKNKKNIRPTNLYEFIRNRKK